MKKDKQEITKMAENTENQYMKTVLYITLISSLVLAGTLTLIGLLMDMRNIKFGTSIAFVFSAIMLWFTYQKKLLVPRLLVPSFAYCLATYTIFTNETIRDITMFVYPMIILLTGMLLGQIGVLLCSLIVTFTVVIVGYADITYRLSPYISHYQNSGNVAFLAAMHIIIGSILYVTIKNLNDNINRAQQSEAESAQRYVELHAISASLEKQVEERTQLAQSAQKKAEEASKILENRMWQFAGIAHMNDMMRGEQDVDTLAQNIVRGLCEYLDVPVGALFILEANTLRLSGGYAYPFDNRDTPSRFPADEGVIGQAVKERRMIKLNDVPANYLDITSGLGQAVPRHILVVPFVEDNQVIGVIELGSFTELFPHQFQFIENILKDIGIAFNTALTRTRINELLNETQHLAEELQSQEEELRAANEELEVQTEKLRESYAKLEQQAHEGDA